MSDNKIYNVYFCGIGGQGVLSAATICGWAAIFDNYQVRQSEIHGMSQRGGSVESHIRFGNEVYSPLIENGQAEYFIALSDDEHDRMLHFKKDSGIDFFPYYEKAQEVVSNKKMINTYILGTLSKHLPISEASWIKAIEHVFKAFIEENKAAFQLGREAVNS